MLRRFVVVAAALLAVVGGPLTLSRAQAGESAGDLAAMTNADRRAHGLRALSTSADLGSVAQRRADEMARSGRLAHTSNLGSKVSGWKRLGENVGRGPDLREIETAFMASPSHRENILDRDFTQFGVGVRYDGRKFLYVAVVFRQPLGAAPAPAPAPPKPTPPTTTRAASAPRPKPKPKPTTTTQAPTTTTTVAPTTTTTAPPPPPPPPTTTTTTTTRPIFTDVDFLAANFADPPVPVAVTSPLPAPGRPVTPIFLAGALGLLVGAGCVATALRFPDQLPEFCRRRPG